MLLRIETRANCAIVLSPIAAFGILSKEIVSLSTFLGFQLFGDRKLRARMYHIRVVKKQCMSVAHSNQRSCVRCSRHQTNVPLLSTVRNVFKADIDFHPIMEQTTYGVESTSFPNSLIGKPSKSVTLEEILPRQVWIRGLLEASPSHGP